MPPPPLPALKCRFEGTADAVHVRGEGRASLVARGALSDGGTGRVELRGASIGAARSPVIERAEGLDGIEVNDGGGAYEVTYRAGPPAEIRVDHGGNGGHFLGPLAGAPACAAAPGCDVVWAGAKVVVLHRKGDAPIEITGALPPGEIQPHAPGLPLIHDVTIHDVKGELRCEDNSVRHIGGDWTFVGGPTHTLSMVPIRLEGGRLAVSVSNDTPPLPVGFPRAALALGIAATVLVVAVIAALALREPRRRRGA